MVRLDRGRTDSELERKSLAATRRDQIHPYGKQPPHATRSRTMSREAIGQRVPTAGYAPAARQSKQQEA
jgi:hypothetical protein